MEEQTTTIRISEKLWNFLNQNKQMSESFEDVIWRYLLKNPKLKKALDKNSVEV